MCHINWQSCCIQLCRELPWMLEKSLEADLWLVCDNCCLQYHTIPLQYHTIPLQYHPTYLIAVFASFPKDLSTENTPTSPCLLHSDPAQCIHAEKYEIAKSCCLLFCFFALLLSCSLALLLYLAIFRWRLLVHWTAPEFSFKVTNLRKILSFHCSAWHWID